MTIVEHVICEVMLEGLNTFMMTLLGLDNFSVILSQRGKVKPNRRFGIFTISWLWFNSISVQPIRFDRVSGKWVFMCCCLGIGMSAIEYYPIDPNCQVMVVLLFWVFS